MVWGVVAVGLAIVLFLAWWLPRTQGSHAPAGAAPTAGAASAGAAPSAPGRPPGAGGPPSVEVASVTLASLQDDVQSVGTLASRQSVVLRPEVSGRIVQVGFTDGARVRRGQLMFQLDDTLQRAELSQAQAQLSIARANLQRNEELVAQNFVARRVLDESRASLQVAEAQVQLAEARVARMRILAPFDGSVGIRQVHPGDVVREGAELVPLEDLSQLYVDFRLPERYQARVAVGQSATVQLDALVGQAFTARVQAVDPQIDANGRSLRVRAVLAPHADHPLRPGLFARVGLVMSVQEQAMMIPEEAVVPQGARTAVFVVERQAEGDAVRHVVRRVEVRLGLRRNAMVQVLDGLSPTDTVVVAGQQRLQRDGMPVRIVDLNRPQG
jgi:membrane fusion protein, multidrug efflux system